MVRIRVRARVRVRIRVRVRVVGYSKVIPIYMYFIYLVDQRR